MTIAQWAVCGFLVWPCFTMFIKVLDKRTEVELFIMLFGAFITGCTGGLLGWIWNW